MDHHHHNHRVVLTTIATSFFFILINLPQSNCEEENEYTICSRPYNCGSLTNIYYPFWGENRPRFCGGGDDSIELSCQDDKTSIRIVSQNFSLLEINNNTYTLKMVRTDLAHDACSPQFGDTYLGPYLSLLPYIETIGYNVSIAYKCSAVEFTPGYNYNFTCGNENAIYYVDSEAPREWTAQVVQNCKQHIEVPAEAHLTRGGIDDLQRVLRYGFHVKYSVAPECMNCWNSGGVCGSNDTAENEHHNHFSCYCLDGSDGLECHVHERFGAAMQKGFVLDWMRVKDCAECEMSGGSCGFNQNTKLSRCICRDGSNVAKSCKKGITSAAVLLICITIFCFRRKSSTWHEKFCLMTKGNQDIEAFLRSRGTLSLKRYKFSDVKKMTSSFKVKLGQGGFGLYTKESYPLIVL